MPRSQKAWVRKHQPSYWSVWFGKNKKKDKGGGSGTDVSSRVAEQGSVQHNPQDQFAGHNAPPPDFPQDQYQHQPPDDYAPPHQQYAPHDVPDYQQPEFNRPLGSLPPFPHRHDADAAHFPEEVNEQVYSSEGMQAHGQPSMKRSPDRGQESFRSGDRIPSMRWSPERGLESFRTGEIPYVPETVRMKGARTRFGERRDDDEDDEEDEEICMQ